MPFASFGEDSRDHRTARSVPATRALVSGVVTVDFGPGVTVPGSAPAGTTAAKSQATSPPSLRPAERTGRPLLLRRPVELHHRGPVPVRERAHPVERLGHEDDGPLRVAERDGRHGGPALVVDDPVLAPPQHVADRGGVAGLGEADREGLPSGALQRLGHGGRGVPALVVGRRDELELHGLLGQDPDETCDPSPAVPHVVAVGEMPCRLEPPIIVSAPLLPTSE